MIRIVTDSACDLPTDLQEEHHISVVPLTIRFGEEEFVDKEELTAGQFWDRLTSGQGLPETAAPSAGTFLETYEHLLKDADGVVVISLSSDLSATYQAAVIAAEKASGPVKVVDSRSVTMGLGLQAIAAARDAASGMDLEEVVAAAATRPAKTTVMAAIDTIEFLKRGGRIGGAAALVAGMLEIKPLIKVNDGVIDAAGRVRTRSKATAAVVAAARSTARDGQLSVFGGRTPDLDKVIDEVASVTGLDVIPAEVGAVVGTHSGPGIVGIAHLAD